MDTETPYLALSEERFYEIGRPEMQPLWYWLMQSDCSDNFAADSSSNCLPREPCIKHATFYHDKRTPGFSEEEFSVKIF